MRSHKLPSTFLDFKELSKDVKNGSYNNISSLSELGPDVIDYRNSFFYAYENGSILSYINEFSHRDHEIRVAPRGHVNFMFTFAGGNHLLLRDRISKSSGVDVVLLINVPDYAVFQGAGEDKRATSFMVAPEVLIEGFGLNIHIMPPHFQAALLGRDSRPLIIKLSLSPRARLSLYNIHRSEMLGRVFERYTATKTEELVCETVFILNNLYSNSEAKASLRNDERLLQSIELAAYHYRQNIGGRDPVQIVAKKVGLNKNKLNAGFRELFGMTPAEYARTFALEWARMQIISGNQNISLISSEIGYSNVSAFSRAYREHFGFSPTQDNIENIVESRLFK